MPAKHILLVGEGMRLNGWMDLVERLDDECMHGWAMRGMDGSMGVTNDVDMRR